MIYASDFRKGITFEINGEPHVVLDFQHVKPGKGAAFVRTKYRNILSGATREEAFNPNDKFPKAHIETKTMQYLYNDGELYYFYGSGDIRAGASYAGAGGGGYQIPAGKR